MSAPGTVYDRRGYPIYPGDIVKTYHFTGARGKKYYLYHMVAETKGQMWLMGMEYQDGRPIFVERCRVEAAGWFDEETGRLEQTEIVQGYGPGDLIDYEARPRRRPTHVSDRESG
jgi:hypothetical protein